MTEHDHLEPKTRIATTKTNMTTNGNGSSEHRAITPRPISKSPINTQVYLSTYPRWLQTVRKLLRRLSKGFVSDEEILNLHIIITELQDSLAGSSSVAVTAIITALIQTDLYPRERRILAAMNFHRAYEARACGAYVSALLMTWTEDLAKEAGRHVEVLRKHRLHITEDSRTRGVRPNLTIVSKGDAQQLPLVSIDQRKEPIEKGLTCIELYTLLAIAAKKYLAHPFADDTIIYQVDMWSIHFHWVQRITANIPSLYMRAMIQGQRRLPGRIQIWRGPSLDFYEDASPPRILQDIFECCELARTSPRGIFTAIPAIQNPKKRKNTVEDDEEKGGKRQRT